MKKLIIVVGTLLLSAQVFANVQSSGINTILSSALKSQHSLQANSNDLAMVYGGQDVSHRPTLVTHTATA